MRAWTVREFGPYAERLAWEELPEPVMGESDALIEVRAAGVNFADILNISGIYQIKSPFPFTPGMETAGEVIAAGPRSRFKPGDRVVTVHVVGGWAERSLAREIGTYRIPDGMSYADAACFTINYQTSYIALMRRGRLKAGETVLVHAGSSGVGTAAIQLAKGAGATVIATASSSEKLDICTQAGADHVINYKDQDFVPAVKELTGGLGADVVYDPVGGDTFDQSTKCMNFEGRILVIGFASGRIAELATNRLLLKNIEVSGVFLGTYSVRDWGYVERIQETLYGMYERGSIKPVIYREYPYEDVKDSLDAIRSRRCWGKPVLVR